MREVTEKMRQKLENGEEESIEEGDDSDKAEYGSRGPSSPDLDEMADLGFGRANPSQHETAFLEVAEKEVKRKKKFKKKTCFKYLSPGRDRECKEAALQ